MIFTLLERWFSFSRKWWRNYGRCLAKTSRGRKQWLTWSRGVPCGSPLKVDCEWRSPPRRHHARGPWSTLWGDLDPCRLLILKCDRSFSELLSPSPYLQDSDVFGLECKPGNWDVYSVLWESVQRSWKLTDVDSILPLRQWHRLLFQRKRITEAIFSPNNKWVIVDTFKWLFHV